MPAPTLDETRALHDASSTAPELTRIEKLTAMLLPAVPSVDSPSEWLNYMRTHIDQVGKSLDDATFADNPTQLSSELGDIVVKINMLLCRIGVNPEMQYAFCLQRCEAEAEAGRNPF